MNRPQNSLLVAIPFVLASTLAACGGGNENLPPPPPQPPPPPAAPAPTVSTPAPAETAAPQPAGPPVAVASGTASPDPQAPLPTVKIAMPAKGQVIAADKAGDFAVKLDVKNWKTAMGDAHVHLILDNKPYKPIYDTKAPVKLSELVGGEALAEGEHVLVAFPSRANHESVKTAGALTMVNFWVGKKGDGKTDPTKQPMLIYSRPKGAYKADMANHILIDFQIANATLGDGKNTVSIAVSGPGTDGEKTAKVDKFGTPFFIDNAQNGSYTLKLELLDKDGKVVPGAWNSTTRTITVDRDAPADAPPPPPAPAASDKDKGATKPADKPTEKKPVEKKPADKK